VIQLILLILGIIAALRYPGLARTSAANFPEVAPDAFAAWHRAEKAAAIWLIVATIGVFGVQIAGGFMLGLVMGLAQAPEARIDSAATTFMLASFGLFLALLLVAGVMGGRAKKLKASAGIVWPKSGFDATKGSAAVPVDSK
jgi:hypothetical protein